MSSRWHDVGADRGSCCRDERAKLRCLSTDRAPSIADPGRVRELTRVLATMRFVTSFAFGAVGTVRILHMDVLDLSVIQIGTVMACYSVLVVVVEVPSGAISDVWGRRNTKLLASWVTVGAYFQLAGATDLLDVAVSAVLLGIGRALFSGAADAWFVDEIGDAKAPEVLAGLARSEAAHNVAFGIGALVGALGPQLYADAFSDRLIFAPIFFLGAAFLSIDLVLTWRKMVEHRPPTRSLDLGVWATTVAGVGNALDSPLPRRTALAMVMVGGAVASTELLTPLGLASDLGTEQALVIFGPLVAGSWIFSAVASTLTQRFAQFVGSTQRAAAHLLLVMALCVVPAGLERWFFPVGSYIAVNFVLGALLPLLSASLHSHVRSSSRSAAASTLNLSLMLGAAGTSFLIGGLEGAAVVIVSVGSVVVAVALLRLPASVSSEESTAT